MRYMHLLPRITPIILALSVLAIIGCSGDDAVAPEPVIIRGTGAKASPFRPDFLDEERPRRSMGPAVERLVRAVASGAVEVPCSGHDYRQALEIAIAIKLSVRDDHRRVQLPLTDRSHRIYPHPYRMPRKEVITRRLRLG